MRALPTCVLVFLVSFVASPGGARAQGIRVEREKVLASFGGVASTTLPLYPVGSGTGRIFRQTINRPGASALRLHFKIESPAQSPAWRVRVLDRNLTEVWAYRGNSAEGDDFWSDEISGNVATVEVFSDVINSTLRLFIDRVAESRPTSTDLAITYPDQRVRMRDQPAQTQAMGKAVARLRFISDDDGKQYYCTGFLVSPSLLLTNNHCIRSDSEMRSALADFDFRRDGVPPKTVRFRELLVTNGALDYTLLRLHTPFAVSEREPLPWDITSPASESRALLIIQHPAGEIQQLSILDCRVRGAQVNGVTPTLTDFGHLCDTLGGSSGSPVQDITSKKVIGLHHLGFLPNAPRLINQAVHIKLVFEHIRLARPDLVTELPVN